MPMVNPAHQLKAIFAKEPVEPEPSTYPAYARFLQLSGEVHRITENASQLTGDAFMNALFDLDLKCIRLARACRAVLDEQREKDQSK